MTVRFPLAIAETVPGIETECHTVDAVGYPGNLAEFGILN